MVPTNETRPFGFLFTSRFFFLRRGPLLLGAPSPRAEHCCSTLAMARWKDPRPMEKPEKVKRTELHRGGIPEEKKVAMVMENEKTRNPFLRSWAWKREHRPDRDRFKNPYYHKMIVAGKAEILVLHQVPFSTAGFASTVWDSVIVLAKYLEKWPETVVGKHCIELRAGCGLAGIAAAALGAKKVVLTDFSENLPLLDRNCAANNLSDVGSTTPLPWGKELSPEKSTFDVVLATDIMYYEGAVMPLLSTLHALAGKHSRIFIAYGRNRQAEETFMRAVGESKLSLRKLTELELDDVYQCVDVDVYELNVQIRDIGSIT